MCMRPTMAARRLRLASIRRRAPLLALTLVMLAPVAKPAILAQDAHPYRIIYPGQRQVEYRDPSPLPVIYPQPSSPPPTVSEPPTGDIRYFALDDAIRTSLGNARVVRLLAGITAVNSGQTIYDTAITNTVIDQALGRFDPAIVVNNNWDYIDLPNAQFDPVTGARITGNPLDQYRMNMALTKQNPLGGQWQFGVNVTEQRFPHSAIPPTILPLNPQTAADAAFTYNQPFLQGAGLRANLAPVVLARINTEISYFQLKDAVQQNVRDVIAAYWNLVAARVTLTARELQVNSLRFAYERLEAQQRFGLANVAETSQAKVSYYQFRAQRIAAYNDVLQREAALRNLIGLPPWDQATILPSTEPVDEPVKPDWFSLIDLAASRRPDLVELKLILEADEQQRIIANNNALPQLNGVGRYRWNGLEGELPSGNGIVASQSGQFGDWTLGVNFSVPIGLRTARAQLRQRELIIARDRANLEQGLHAASHQIATTLRSLDQTYEQYEVYTVAKEAAELNRDQQFNEYLVGRAILLNLLLAVTDLGNAIIGQAQALADYNTRLADLELQTGTILETHGVRFYEERYGSIGPLWHSRSFPQSTPPTPNADRYPTGDQPAERFFNLPDPNLLPTTRRRPENLPPAQPSLPNP